MAASETIISEASFHHALVTLASRNMPRVKIVHFLSSRTNRPVLDAACGVVGSTARFQIHRSWVRIRASLIFTSAIRISPSAS